MIRGKAKRQSLDAAFRATHKGNLLKAVEAGNSQCKDHEVPLPVDTLGCVTQQQEDKRHRAAFRGRSVSYARWGACKLFGTQRDSQGIDLKVPLPAIARGQQAGQG